MDILLLQTLLCGRGYGCGLTQKFDDNTYLAVLDLKKKNGLSVENGDGTCTSEFWKLLITE